MPNITAFNILEKRIEELPGRPTVLEALWDGDTNGWFLLLYLYKKTGKLFWKKQTRYFLGEITLGGDIRIFNGQVPPWPEAILAKEIGQKASEKYGLVFYFPSEREPDNNCPKWTDKHLAINCADCNKMIIPTGSPYLPGDICYSCHLNREHREKLKNNEPFDDEVTMFLYKDGDFEHIGYCTFFKDFSIAPFLQSIIERKKKTDGINIVTINADETPLLRNGLHAKITTYLNGYEKSKLEGDRRKFGLFETVLFDGKEYEFETRFNHTHAKISGLIHSYYNANKAVSKGCIYKIYFKRGFTYRDDSLLRFINYVCNGSTNIAVIIDRYKKTLAADEVSETLEKLKLFGCIEIQSESISILETGRHIL